jgi:sulfoxide reductase catalytic subunit YedY
MLIRKSPQLTYADVTPKSVYLDRRKFLQAMGIVGATAVAGKGIFDLALPPQGALAATQFSGLIKSPFSTTEKPNTLNDVSHYNNYYEFGTDKADPAKYAQNFKTSPWTVSVEGEVSKPRKFTMDEILKLAPLEERIYRHRCVERWSIVVPWIGFSFNILAKLAEPTAKARYVAFLDEAMNPLTLLCVGMYGDSLPPQDGAPVRMVIPWKYGYKSIKSLVKIRFQEKEPPTTWNRYSSDEYGFYSNVNPNVDHPRWSQAKERRLGEIFTRPTVIFNGYGDQVASMYSGMDLKKFH